ncbi:MAG: 4Fe-4S dicluster domain-containing protein [Candidatus Hydrothermae bacterium]|nr:4Fe-4S dicluster domain-containing protein [Candidatus Hydrothermae bacterium]
MSGEVKKVTVFIMGQKYEVPEGFTILNAIEYAGYQLKRGVGCREGFCGACATVYKLPGDYKLRGGLACQTVVQEGMYIAQIPFTPAQKATYDLNELKPDVTTFQKLYPEAFRCLGCNACSKVCPQEIKVMDYIQAIMRGDIALAADLSFDCIMCGLCAMRCPAEMAQYNIALLARRLYGKYMMPKPEFLEKRLKEIEEGKFDREIEKLMKMDRESLAKKYSERDINFEIT